MTYYVLPKNYNKITENNFDIKTNDESLYKIFISNSVCDYLMKSKSLIDIFPKQWDNFKKYINPYEFIHSNVPNSRTPIAKYKPLSRSYYKFIEIANNLNILEQYESSPIKSFHLAEGPGGFIEAINGMRQNKADIYYGMTLINSEDINIPGWSKSKAYLEKHPNIILETGATHDGDLYRPENLIFCYNNYRNSMDVITADGGFDFSVNYNEQEILAVKLIFTQIIYALIMQKYNGSFVLKVFDLFNAPSVQLIYLLTAFYQEVNIVKPNTSRYANSERYIVCKNFKYKNTSFLINRFAEILKSLESKMYVTNILNIKMPYHIVSKIDEINTILGQQQIESIENTISLIQHNKSEKLEKIKKQNVQKCINWCIKYNIPYYKNINQYNIFLTKEC